MSILKTKVISAPINGATVEPLALQTNDIDRLTVAADGTVTAASGFTDSSTRLRPLVSSTAKVAVTDFTTSADFTSIPSWAKRITVMFNGISLSGTDAILIRLGDSGGLETTGYISSGTGFTGAAGSTVNNTTGFIVPSDTAAYLISGIVVITNISGNTWVESGSGKLSTAASWICGGDKTLSDTLTQLSVTRTGTNTFDAGTINIMWE